MTRTNLIEVWDRYGSRALTVTGVVDDTGRYLEISDNDRSGPIDLDQSGAQELIRVLSSWVEWV
jgi:hypothetical protein